MTRDEAMADMLAAIADTDDLGTEFLLNGLPVVGLKRKLTVEELQLLADGGSGIEGLRISIDYDVLGYRPVNKSRLTVDGKNYTVNTSSINGNMLKLTMTRYTA